MSGAEYQRRWRAEKARQEGREPGKAGRPQTQPCGTVAAYKRHQRAGEPACQECLSAWAEKQREMYRARKGRG